MYSFSSPEIYPSHSSTTDLSLYFFDPRETFLRQSRISSTTSTPRNKGSTPRETNQDVWTGKGLVSWALAEAGDGKSLITGRILRNRSFASASAPAADVSGLEALVAMADQPSEEAWGIEVAIALKSGMPGLSGSGPLAATMSTESGPSRRISPLSPARTVKATPHGRHPDARARTGSGKRKAGLTDRVETSGIFAESSPGPRPAYARTETARSFPDDIPASVYDNPHSLTKAQAERLIQSPAFLAKLEKLTGQPLKRVREGEASREPYSKIARKDAKIPLRGESGHTPKCYNCGRTKSAVWRQKVLDDGKSVRVCNGERTSRGAILMTACGLYWNKCRMMRPPALWDLVDADVEARPGGRKASISDSVETPQSDGATLAEPPSGFKRTLSSVVNNDAERIAASRAKKSRAEGHPRLAPITSPIRASTSAVKSVRNTKWNADAPAASSPGGWAETPQAAERTGNAAITLESPNTVIRRILGDEFTKAMNAPASDGATSQTSAIDWSTDFSTLFDLPTDQVPDQSTSDADEILTQLFNGTSSAPPTSPHVAFDFSQLPPSSPPAMPSDPPQPHQLYSSPILSDAYSVSPADYPTSRSSPGKGKSKLKHGFTPEDVKMHESAFFPMETIGERSDEIEVPAELDAAGMRALQEMLDRLQQQGGFAGDEDGLMRLLAELNGTE